ncbi:MAG TPA: TetR/AcrR family transcriptional regulator [Fluviicoccus sp.]|nr:TetR/AcrR family transcriptional regulator [Fluviicoccus sp.]
MREKLVSCLKQLARRHPLSDVTPDMLAETAGVPVGEVNQTLGSPENYPALLAWEQPPETRERILQSAMQVFVQKGWQKASLDEIAAAAGLTKGAIYWHFRNKHDLFFALMDARLQRDTSPVPAEIRQAITRSGNGETLEAVSALFGAAWKRCASDRDWPRLYMEVLSQAGDPEVSMRLQAMYRHLWDMSAGFVRAMQDGGLTRTDIPPQDLAVLWCAIFDGIAFAGLADPSLDVEEMARRLIPLVWGGIAPPAG